MQQLSIEQLLAGIKKLESYFQSYPNTEHETKLASIEQSLVDKTYNIAIVANMSAGKSTLINALFGEHILPAYNEATTDCATYIHSEPNISKKAIITFENGNMLELEENTIKNEIKKYSRKDSAVDDDNYHNVKKIDLYYPFKRIQNSKDSKQKDYKIIFIDTPGPNNTGDFAEKHRSQTRQILREIDMALFIFDYGQLDACLEDGDKQGLWNTIKERKTKDKEGFEVFFIINKIDMIFNSSDNIEKGDECEQWNLAIEKKNDAIKKLKDAASKHGIEDAKIFCVASEFGLSHRMGAENLSHNARGNLNTFLNSHPDEDRGAMIELIGIETIEDAINGYIENEVGRRLITDRIIRIGNIAEKEKESIQREIITYGKSKEEAQDNLNKAETMCGDIENLEKQTLEKQDNLHNDTLGRIKKMVTQRLEKDLFSQTEEIATDAIIFMKHYAEGEPENLAKKIVVEYMANPSGRQSFRKTKQLEAISQERAQASQRLMPGYIQERINDCINNFLDITTEFKNIYSHYQGELDKLTTQAGSSVRERLNAILGLELESTMPEFIKEEYRLTFDAVAIDTTPNLPPVYMERSWGDKIASILTCGWKGKGKPAIPINYKKLHKEIKEMLDEKCKDFEENELEKHRQILNKLKKENQNSLQEAIKAQKKEIAELQRKLKEEKEPLKEARLREDAFHKSSEWLKQQTQK